MAKKPKRTIYQISTGNGRKVSLKIRGRTKPRKIRTALIKKFNDLVDKGHLFLSEDKIKATKREYLEIGKKVWDIINEPGYKKLIKQPKIRQRSTQIQKSKRLRDLMQKHERKGSFKFINAQLEHMLLDSTEWSMQEIIEDISKLEQKNKSKSMEIIKMFNSSKKIENNLKRQLEYFKKYLKKINKQETVIQEDVIDKPNHGKSIIITKVRLNKGRTIKEITEIEFNKKKPPYEAGMQIIMHPNKKIETKIFTSL